MPSLHVQGSSSVKTSLLVLSAVLAALVCTTTAKPAKNSRLAKYLPNLCKISDPMIDKCMTDNVKEILKYAKTGIPELHIPTLEPFVIQELDLKMFQGLGAVSDGGGQKSDKRKAFARNLIIHHTSEFTINELKSNIKNREFYIDLTFPRFEIEGEYDVNLQMFNMPIKSTGPIKINITDISVKATLNGQTIKRKTDETYLLFDSISIKVDFKDYSVMIDKLFKKDQNLNRAINDMIKTQKAEIRKLTMPMIEELGGKMVLDMVNKILTSLPLEEVFIMD